MSLDVEETGTTFAENARIKAREACRLTGLAAIADDSGLCVDALDGAPGLYSARYTGSHDDSDEARLYCLLRNLEGVEKRSARFISAICCVLPDGTVLRSEGICEGTVLHTPAGRNGFGYDPIFRPAGFETSMAEMTADEKNKISHRGKALEAFRAEWERYYAQQ